jgi:hypothetical protein
MTQKTVVRAAPILFRRDKDGYERIVMAELLIPNTPNCYGDIYTQEAIREFVEQFAAQGHGLDVNHAKEDVQGQKLLLVESFIAREGDPDFTPGSWVIGMKVLDDELWEQILNNELNGFSFEAECFMTPVEYEDLTPRSVEGNTEPYLIDGHTHSYFAMLDGSNNILAGGTGTTDGHSHTISTHSVTDVADGHTHRIQVHQL